MFEKIKEKFNFRNNAKDKNESIDTKEQIVIPQKEYPIRHIFRGVCYEYPEYESYETIGEVEYNYTRDDYFLIKEINFPKDISYKKTGVVKKLTGVNAGKLCRFSQCATSIEIYDDIDGVGVVYKTGLGDEAFIQDKEFFKDAGIGENDMFITEDQLKVIETERNMVLKTIALKEATRTKTAEQKTKQILEAEFGEEE